MNFRFVALCSWVPSSPLVCYWVKELLIDYSVQVIAIWVLFFDRRLDKLYFLCLYPFLTHSILLIWSWTSNRDRVIRRMQVIEFLFWWLLWCSNSSWNKQRRFHRHDRNFSVLVLQLKQFYLFLAYTPLLWKD